MHSAPLPPAYDELVHLCYESVLDASCWPTLLNKLSAATGRQFGAVGFGRPPAQPGPEELRPIDPLADDEPALPAAPGALPPDMPQPGEHGHIYLALLTTIDTQPGGAHGRYKNNCQICTSNATGDRQGDNHSGCRSSYNCNNI